MNTIKPIQTTIVQTPTAIKDFKTDANQGIILVNQKSMQQIFLKSGKNAKTNEFQTHYWAINYRYTAKDNSILDICVPTVYFNYAQEVSSAAIDFDLKDVKKYSEKLEPVHNMIVHRLNEYNFHEKLEKILGIKLESSPSNYNSIHRHPGSSHAQSFSATDLTKTANEPGVVYPLARASNTPNFAGIMTIDSGKCNVAHYEYRIASGTIGTDITYTKGRCAAIMTSASSQPSAVEQLMGIEPKILSYNRLDNCTLNNIITMLSSISHDLYINYGFEAFTDSVVDTHIEEKSYRTTTYYGEGSVYNPNAELEAYRHAYITKEELQKKTGYLLNQIYKGMKFQETGKRIHLWLSPETEAINMILKLQSTLGFTEKNPAGNVTFTFKTITQLNAMTYQEVRNEFRAMLQYFEPSNKQAIKNIVSLNRAKLLKKINKYISKMEAKLTASETNGVNDTEKTVITVIGEKKSEEQLIKEFMEENYGEVDKEENLEDVYEYYYS
jgi:predicted transcriptional regulator